MKLVVEIDLTHPDHDTARMAMAAIVSMVQTIARENVVPAGFDLQKMIETYTPGENFAVLLEGTDDNDHEWVNCRMQVLDTPFDTKARAPEQSERHGRKMASIETTFEVNLTELGAPQEG